MYDEESVDDGLLIQRISKSIGRFIRKDDITLIDEHLRKIYRDIYIETFERDPSLSYYYHVINDAIQMVIPRRTHGAEAIRNRWVARLNNLIENVIDRYEEYDLIRPPNNVAQLIYCYEKSNDVDKEVHVYMSITAFNQEHLMVMPLEDKWPTDYRYHDINVKRENLNLHDKYGDFKEIIFFKREIDPYSEDTVVSQVAIIEYDDRIVEMIDTEPYRTTYKRDLFRGDLFRPIHNEMLYSLDTPSWYLNDARKAQRHFATLTQSPSHLSDESITQSSDPHRLTI